MPNFSQKYRDIYLEAADRADREQWEYVEESAIRAVLEERGFADLLDNGKFSKIDGWLRNDVSDDDEDPRPRWYYPSGDEPRPDEFRRFHDLLTDAAPDEYEPFYLRVTPAGKAPDTKHGSWKGEEARLTFDEAVERMENGGNVGIAGRGGCIECGGDGVDNGGECEACDGTGDDPQNEDALVNLDIDDDEETSAADVPSSLRARSRSRTGWHSWFFDTADEIPNIPTDEYGEVRTNWQFVLAPGSFAASTAEGIPSGADNPGYYTVEDAKPVASIEYGDLPSVFHEVAESAAEATDQAGGSAASGSQGKLETQLSEITTDDLAPSGVDEGDRFSSIFHGSKTGQNTSIDGDRLHCWRHGVAHGGLQALATLSNVEHVANFGCKEIGKAHKNSGAGPNRLKGDWRLQWGAFHEAKQRGLIADDDPIPHDVLTELAVADGIVDRDDLVERGSDGDSYEALPVAAYDDTLDHVREEYGVDPGRQKKGAMAAPSSTIGTEAEATDGGVAVSDPSADEPSIDDSGHNHDLIPADVAVVANLGEDQTLADLNDRQKAAAVWSIIRQHDGVHVRCRRDNAALWAYDTDTGTWSDDGERVLRHAAVKALTRQQYGSNVLAELKAQARADYQVELEADEFGVDTGTVAVANGLLDLDAAAAGDGSDAIRELQPDDYALARLPVEFDPTAEHDEWSGYVDEWVESGYADALQEFVGYCLHVGSMPIHRALLLVGSGSNGKGTFLHVVRTLLGSENTSSTELQTLANESNAVADMHGALANIDDDLSSRGLGSGLGMFKKLVGGDPVRAEQKYEQGFEFEPSTKHLYACNQVPDVKVSDEDEAFWRRWLLVEFPNHYPPAERDSSLRDRLTDDEALAGVLNWAIEGRRRLLDQGHFTGELDLAYDKRRRWQQWGDTVDEFIESCVEHDSGADRITTGDAYQVYQEWCRRSGDDPVGQRRFTDSVKTEGVGFGKHRIDGTVTNGYTALGFTDEAPDLDAALADDGDDESSDSQNQAIDEFDDDGDDDHDGSGGGQAADSGDDADEVDDLEGDDADDEASSQAGESGDEQADNDDDGARWGSALGTITTKVDDGAEIDPADLADRTDKAELYWSKALEGLADHYDAVERDGSGGYRRAG